ncbi:MAG TPA: hypothetical protein VE398_17345 [Acidobacteriota bacterium]|nr:hypothetical protein [Acidobacteriota bacterium]
MPAIFKVIAVGAIFLVSASNFATTQTATLPGYVVHFDFLSNVRESRELVRVAKRAGARVINIVPPAHIWESSLALRMLDAILDEIRRNKLSFVFTRIDAAFPAGRDGVRFNYLYGRILTELARLPDGSDSQGYFRATAGLDSYDNWMEEEARYYARHYAHQPNLLGINLGPFSEPFVSQRGSLLDYEDDTQCYEIIQYTPYAVRLWHRWLSVHFNSLDDINREYGTTFKAITEIPLPKSERDTRFGNAQPAYFDFARSLNDWFTEHYETCRRIWHEEGGSTTVPFILQLSGFLAEKLALGRAGLAAFDLPDWIARADALGMSIYTNNGYPDYGHASVRATVNLVATARDLGKDVFVLEGGCEAPNVVLDPEELKFFGSAARKLNPRTYIYEFLKAKYAEQFPSNPGKLVAWDGKIQAAAFKALRDLFEQIAGRPAIEERPVLYAVIDPRVARKSVQAGALNAALYDLASDVPIRFVTPSRDAKGLPGVPVLHLDGSVMPPNERLSSLMRSIPPVDSAGRPAWRSSVISALARGSGGGER